MAEFPIPDTARVMGRPPLGVKPTVVRLSQEVRDRIAALVGKTGMAKFIRDAVEAELRRREAASSKSSTETPAFGQKRGRKPQQ